MTEANRLGERVLRRVMQHALPAGGVILSLVEGFFDESEAGLGQKIFCIGGYLVESDFVDEFSTLWSSRSAEDGVDTFHMKDCAHGNGQFKNLSIEKRSQLVFDLISLIHKYAIAGVTVSAQIELYKKYSSGRNYFADCSTALLCFCGDALRDEQVSADILFNFEAGHRFQGSADRAIIEYMQRDDCLLRYAGHAYYPKKSGPVLLQAADLLVWLTSKNNKNIASGKKPRSDAMYLRKQKHYELTIYHIDGDIYLGIATPSNQIIADPVSTDMTFKALFSGEVPSIPWNAFVISDQKKD